MIYSTILGTLTLSSLAIAENLHCTDQCLRSEKPGDRPIMSTNGAMARKQNYWTHMKMVIIVNYISFFIFYRIIKLEKLLLLMLLLVSMVLQENILAQDLI